jgi:hypothetical protein
MGSGRSLDPFSVHGKIQSLQAKYQISADEFDKEGAKEFDQEGAN